MGGKRWWPIKIPTLRRKRRLSEHIPPPLPLAFETEIYNALKAKTNGFTENGWLKLSKKQAESWNRLTKRMLILNINEQHPENPLIYDELAYDEKKWILTLELKPEKTITLNL